MDDHRLFALVYDRIAEWGDRAGLAGRRERLVAQASGTVLEIGGGTGRNLLHYRGVDKVVVVEPSASMRKRLLVRMRTSDVPVEVIEAGIEDVQLPDATFDTIVSTLVLCSVHDQAEVIAILHRLLKPTGHLLFIEHVAHVNWRSRVQGVLSPVWSRLAAGCRLDRDTIGALRAGGFSITECDKFRFPGLPRSFGVGVQGRAHHAPIFAGATRTTTSEETA